MSRNSNPWLIPSLLLFLSACPIKFNSNGLGEESSITGNTTVNSSFNTWESPTSDTLGATNTSNTDALIMTGLVSSTLGTTSDFESTSTSTSSSSDTDSDSTENRASTEGMISICGNYVVEPLEECDEGPLGSSECLATCKLSFCGDGYLNSLAKEQCDDFNKIDDDDCSNDCIRPRIVFLTSDYIGTPKFGGVKVADDYCQNNANQLGLSGYFRAWLSDSNPKNDPVERFGDFSAYKGWYRLPSFPPTPVLKGGEFQLNPKVPINITASGFKDIVVDSVWTNTKFDGTAMDPGSTCNDWTLNGGSYFTYIGSPQSANNYWSILGSKACSSGVGSKLYCFETNQ
jgi:cysteine-rich repeat protein